MRDGVKNFSNCYYLSTLEELLANLSNKYEKLAPLCAEAFNIVEAKINAMVEEKFNDNFFYIDDQQGEVDEIYDIEIYNNEPTLLKVEDNVSTDWIVAEFVVDQEISFNATITYDDLETASYDSEHKVLIPWRRITEHVESTEFPITYVQIKISKKNPQNVEIEDITTDFNDSITVTSTVNRDWPYK